MAASMFLIMLMAALSIPPSVLGSVVGPTGVCPLATGPGICVEACFSHSDCKAQGKLCCSTGCGQVCMAPVDPNAPPPARPCTLMTVPVNIGESGKLMMQVPKPRRHSILSGVGILILNYGTDQNTECCRAQEWLSESESVKSVEFDGPSPSCPSLGLKSTHFMQSKPERLEETVAGGWSKDESMDEEDLEVWNKVVAQIRRHKDIQLGALGAPVSVTQQVVAGINYNFKFSDGSTVQVFRQPWTDTLEVTDAEVSSGRVLYQ
mmetsp:Transcript_64718/g.124847  ORF Transcript_64718/g.124847 Transcript_64718/m.124847 type:complete len:263 (-) Transcript_64718:127-915(-)